MVTKKKEKEYYYVVKGSKEIATYIYRGVKPPVIEDGRTWGRGNSTLLSCIDDSILPFEVMPDAPAIKIAISIRKLK